MARHFRRQALAWLTAVAAPAFADAPLVSETADVIGGDACQIEAAVSRARARGTAPMSGNDVLGCTLLTHNTSRSPENVNIDRLAPVTIFPAGIPRASPSAILTAGAV